MSTLCCPSDSASDTSVGYRPCGPTNSSVARMRWADDGGPCEPLSDRPCVPSPVSYSTNKDDSWREEVELVSLPFAEYSAVYPERLEWLRSRLKSESPSTVRFVIVDVTRVSRPGGLLLGVLHASAARLLKDGRCLVLAGDLSGLASVSNLTRLCHVAASREAAFACRQEQLTD